MVDVAASVAGLISLGITISKGIVDYYGSFRGAERDILSLSDSASSLHETLLLVQKRLGHDNVEPDLKARAATNLLACKNSIKRLQHELEKVSKVPTNDGWRGKMDSMKGKLAYPFQEKTLVKLRAVCVDLRDNVQLTLNILQIDVANGTDIRLQSLAEELQDLSTLMASVDNTSVEARDATLSMQQNLSGALNRAQSFGNNTMNTIRSISNITAETRDAVVSSQRKQLLKEAFKWVSPLVGDFQLRQTELRDLRCLQEDSAVQVLKTPQFRDWILGNQNTLWCHGAAGVGKTVIASTLIKLLQGLRQKGFGVAFIYCNYQQAHNHSARNLIGSIIQQLASSSTAVENMLIMTYEHYRTSDTEPSLYELTSILKRLCSVLPRTFVIIDALDELSEVQGFRSTFMDQLSSLVTDMNILVLSRPLPDIRLELDGWPELRLLAPAEVVQQYLRERLMQSKPMRQHFVLDPSLMPDAILTIVEKSRGMFLLARLYVESFLSQTTRRRMRSALQTLPPSLDGAYEQLLQRIKSQNDSHAELATKVIALVQRARRPLSVEQLQEALAIQPGDEDIDEEDKPLDELIISVCLGFVVVTDGPYQRQVFAFEHYTALEFLNSKAHLLPISGDEILAMACLTRLSMDPKVESFDFRSYGASFCAYAGSHWGDHARHCEHEKISELAVQYLSSSRDRFTVCQAVIPFQYSLSVDHGIHVASSFGLMAVTQRLLSLGQNPNATCLNKTTALFHAVINNHSEIVKLLLDHGTRTDGALHVAAMAGYTDMVLLLLARGIDVDTRKGHPDTPLLVAAEYDQINTARILLMHGAKVNARTDNHVAHNQTPLHVAAWKGHKDIVELLLAWRANNKLLDSEGMNPCERAKEFAQYDIAVLIHSANLEADFPPLVAEHKVSPLLIANAKGTRDEPIAKNLGGSGDVIANHNIIGSCSLVVLQNWLWDISSVLPRMRLRKYPNPG